MGQPPEVDMSLYSLARTDAGGKILGVRVKIRSVRQEVVVQDYVFLL